MARYSTRPAVKTKSSATKSTTTTTTTRIPVITSQSGRDSLKSSQSIEGGRLLTPGIAKGLSIFSSIPTINTKYHTKIFTGNEGATLQDIVFCNLSTDEFYVYCTKASSDGILDVTVLK